MALNRCEFIGHFSKKAEIKVLDGGSKVASFSIGVTKRGYTSKNGTEVPEKTTWVNIVAWRGLAEIVEKYTDKGSHVYVSGELNTRSYEKDGVTRYLTEIVAENIELLGKRPQEAQTQGQPQAAIPQQSSTPSSWTPMAMEPEGIDDLPF
jgi:single-strand DNA-binding protein